MSDHFDHFWENDQNERISQWLRVRILLIGQSDHSDHFAKNDQNEQGNKDIRKTVYINVLSLQIFQSP